MTDLRKAARAVVEYYDEIYVPALLPRIDALRAALDDGRGVVVEVEKVTGGHWLVDGKGDVLTIYDILDELGRAPNAHTRLRIEVLDE